VGQKKKKLNFVDQRNLSEYSGKGCYD